MTWLVPGYALYRGVYAAAGSLAERQEQVQSLARPLSARSSNRASPRCMYACTGTSPPPLGICGFPPDRSFGLLPASLAGLTSVMLGGLSLPPRCLAPLTMPSRQASQHRRPSKPPSTLAVATVTGIP